MVKYSNRNIKYYQSQKYIYKSRYQKYNSYIQRTFECNGLTKQALPGCSPPGRIAPSPPRSVRAGSSRRGSIVGAGSDSRSGSRGCSVPR